jgi:DNA-directed RNA polymerase specialized sigma24 family protein
MAFTIEEIATAYEELRAVSRRMSRQAPATLAGTAGVHEVLSRIVQSGPTEWRDRSHFIAYCLRALQHAWIDHVRHRRRHHAVDAVRSYGAVRRDERLEDVDTFVTALHLLDDLAADASIEAREQISHVALCRHVLEMTEAETAEAVGISVATVKRRLAAFHEWAQRWAEPHVHEVAAAIDGIATDGALRHGRRIAEVARAVHIRGRSLAEVAAEQRRSVAELRRDLDFFRAWAVARGGHP